MPPRAPCGLGQEGSGRVPELRGTTLLETTPSKGKGNALDGTTTRLGSVARRVGVLVLAASLLASSTGCFGGFGLTRNVHKFNREVSPDKWVQELVFLGFVIIPVYGIATLADAIIFNSIEFWTGESPISDAGTRESPADESACLTPPGGASR